MAREMMNIGTWNTISNFDDTVAIEIFSAENFKNFVYHCSAGVPTIGYGTALLVKDGNGQFSRNNSAIRDLGITLTIADSALLDEAMRYLNDNRVSDAKRVFPEPGVANSVDANVMSFIIEENISRHVALEAIGDWGRTMLTRC